MALILYNTLSRKKEIFKPIRDRDVTLYTCGPTVYHYAHIGNLRTYVFEDILKRTLLYLGYRVIHVMNITDVGHLTSDQDEGEDKMEKGARREGKTVWEIADFYLKTFQKDLRDLNILDPDQWVKATEEISTQIKLIQTLEKKGLTYVTSDGVYFNTSRYPNYAELAKLDIKGLHEGARVGVNREKKNITDFALWKFSPKDTRRAMEWDSPWGRGFPGWHLECSAIAMKYLGETLDIHCGGIDHIPVHHTNERAQSECATGKPFARFWMHGGYLSIGENEEKMAKSGENFITLNTLMKKNIDPLSYRYHLLTAHYRSQLQFSWESLLASRIAFQKLRDFYYELPDANEKPDQKYKQEFIEKISDDLNTPRALALIWDITKDADLEPKQKKALIKDFDQILGLDLENYKPTTISIPREIINLAQQRKQARRDKDWKKADQLRDEIEKQGYMIEDMEEDFKLLKK